MTNTNTNTSGFYTTPQYYFYIGTGIYGNGTCKHESFSVLPLYSGENHIQHQCNSCSVNRMFQRYAGKKGGRK